MKIIKTFINHIINSIMIHQYIIPFIMHQIKLNFCEYYHTKCMTINVHLIIIITREIAALCTKLHVKCCGIH